MKILKTFILSLFLLLFLASPVWAGTPVYCNDGGSNTAPYETWAKAATTMATALGAVDAGGTIYVQSDHNEQFGGDTSLNSTNGAAATPVTIISVTNTNEPPEAGDYQTMMTGGGSLDAKTGGAYDITLNGWDIWIGLEFISGDDLSLAKPTGEKSLQFIDCKFSVDDDTAICGTAEEVVSWENVDIVQVTDGTIHIQGNLYWRGGSFTFNGGSIATNFLTLSSATAGNVVIEDVDIQDLDAGDYLINDSYACHDILFKRCKIPAAVNYMNSGPGGPATRARFHSVDDGNYIYKFIEYYFEGKIEDAINCKLDATYDGTNGYSVKMTSNGNAKEWVRPLRFKLAEIWCAANPTLTIETITSNVTLQNDEFWIEIEYPDGTTGALGKIDQTSRPATILTAPGNLTSSTESWTEDLANEVKQKIAETISGGQAGIHTIWICLGKASTTVYVDSKITVS